jgi:NAD(P)-dependent dehydrogenase (short-subunit alcohol dehydrogenase family)
MLKLEGKVAIVTGGGRGLGRAIAEELGREGASIAILERDPETGPQAVGELEKSGVAARSYQADVSIGPEVTAAIAGVARDFGHVDILINNAGIGHLGEPTHEVSDELWQASIGIMQTGVFLCSRAVAQHLIEAGRPGSIVHISSIRGFSPNPGRVAYCAAKAATIMMAHVMAAEWGRFGIRVNAVAPGVQKTPMWDVEVQTGLLDEDRYIGLIPLGRIGDPHEVGRLCAFLCSNDASYITGGCITIDGGLTCVPSG